MVVIILLQSNQVKRYDVCCVKYNQNVYITISWVFSKREGCREGMKCKVVILSRLYLWYKQS